MSELISRQKLIEELENTSLDVELWTSMKPHEIVSATIEAYLDHAIKIIKSQPPADQWIPCSERLPQDEQDVIGTTDEGIVEKVWFNKHSKTWYGSPFTRRKTVTAWMPLPEPYKGVE